MCTKPEFNWEERIDLLIRRIHKEREELADLGARKGFHHHEVQAKSQKIDRLVNEYYALIKTV